MRLLLFIVFCLCFLKNVSAQTDTIFWFAAPEIIVNNDNGVSTHTDRPVYLNFTALSQTTLITITQPANGSFNPITVTVPANSSRQVDLTSIINQIENKPAATVLTYGLKITSTAPITAYYEIASEDNPEMFVLKGSNALGKKFFIPTQTIMNNWDNTPVPTVPPTNSFDIIATEDNTVVTITVAQNVVGHNAGETFNIILNKGQTYSVQATSREAAKHLMGSMVVANKPIAITLKDDSIGGGGYYNCLDAAGDQLVPIDIIGTKYISVPGYLNNPVTQPSDIVFLLATEDNTIVTINGVPQTAINTGNYIKFDAYNNTAFIESNKPIYALHLSGFACEVGSALLPPVECTGSSQIGFNRSSTKPLYLNVLVPKGFEDKFTFNGNASIIKASDFKPVANSNNEWLYARVLIDNTTLPLNATAIVANSAIEFHLGIIQGDGQGCKYGYFSDYKKLKLSLSSNTVNGKICEKDTLKLKATHGQLLQTSFVWSGPNSFAGSNTDTFVANIATTQTGMYKITANKPSCKTIADSANITVTKLPYSNPFAPSVVCSESNIALASTIYPRASYLWSGPQNYSSTNANASIFNISTKNAGKYYINITDTLGCKSLDSISIWVDKRPDVFIAQQPDAIVCDGDTVQLFTATNGNFTDTSYTWRGPNNFFATTPTVSLNNTNVFMNGYYVLTAMYKTCLRKDSMLVASNPKPIANFIAPTSFCSNAASVQLQGSETAGVAGIGVFTGLGVLAGGLFNPRSVADSQTLITYTYTAAGGCKSVVDRVIKINPAPQINILTSTVYTKPNQPVVLNANVFGGKNNKLLWTPSTYLSDVSTLNPTSTPNKNITYKLTATSDDGCLATDTLAVLLIEDIKLTNAFSPNGDGINDWWVIQDPSGVKQLKLNIFDRYGKLVYSSFGTSIKWDGKYNGQPLPVATYYYVLTVTDGATSTNQGGWIQLLR